MIIAFPHRPGSGGPGSFQERFERVLRQRGWEIDYLDGLTRRPDLVFVVGGSRKLLTLAKLKVKRVPIIFRLDGILWLHRKRWPGMRNFVDSELRNILLKITHAFIADYLIYQSEFVKAWWRRSGWRSRSDAVVIHNGVDLMEFDKSAGRENARAGSYGSPELICMEGHIDYSPFAVELLNKLTQMLSEDDVPVRLYGAFSNPEEQLKLSNDVDYSGFVHRGDVRTVFNDGVYLSLDVNAACPNTVIEAMSCGAPVVGFNTGGLSELVPDDCGRLVDFGGDPWALDFPDVIGLRDAVLHVIENFETYSRNARIHAEEHFDIEDVASKYLSLVNRAVARDDEVS